MAYIFPDYVDRSMGARLFTALAIVATILISGCATKEPTIIAPTTSTTMTTTASTTTMSPTTTTTVSIVTTTIPSNKLARWVKEDGVRTGGISSSTMVKNSEYWMYYTSNGIELSISADGLNFISKGTVIGNGPAGSEQEMVTNPSVFELSDGRYRMIYEGARLTRDEKGKFYQSDRKLYSAISGDGRKWAKESGVRFWDYGDGKPGYIFTSVPDVIRLSDGRLRMYYTRGITSATAISSDEGVTWAKETNLELGKVAVDPDVLILEGGYKLFFTTFEDEFGVGEQWAVGANSADGINFTLDEGKIIEPGTAGGLVTDPDVIETGSGYRMYYGEFKNNDPEPNIMSAFSVK